MRSDRLKRGVLMNDTASGINDVTVDRMIRILSSSYASLIERGTPFDRFPSVMLWGPPGVGKSQGVRQAARLVQERTGKRVVITDVRLLLFNPVDLRGIPTANEDRTLAVWLKPKIFQMDESPDVVNILFLDEISSAPPSVQAAAYQITLDRTVGEHRLPDNCLILAAGNRVTDRSVTYNMPKALANRLCHFEIKGDPASWHDWAVRNGIHPYVTGYIEYDSGALMRFEPSDAEVAFPTPRTWEMVSRILTDVSVPAEDIDPMICGCIGSAAAQGFRAWIKLSAGVPDLADVFAGTASAADLLGEQYVSTRLEKEPEVQIALRAAMTAYARTHAEQEKIDVSIDFACGMPWSFRGKLLHDYALIPALRPLLERNAVYQTAVGNGLT